MLTTQSYVLAFVVWYGAAFAGLLILGRWLPAHWPAGLRWGLLGALAGLLLAPATPNADSATLAPALIVAVFNTLFGEGWPSAVPAVAVLVAVTAGLGLIGALMGHLVVGRSGAAGVESTETHSE